MGGRYEARPTESGGTGIDGARPASLRYAVLGPVGAWRGEVELNLGPPKQRALLAMLLVRVPDPLPVHEAVDILWGDDPPPSAVNVIHRHMGSLRRLLEPGLTRRTDARELTLSAAGYRLTADAGSLDLLRFRELRAQARRLLAAGDRERGARLLLEALELWRGPVAAGIPPAVQAHPLFVAVLNKGVATVKEAADALPPGAPELAEDILVILRRAAEQRPMDEALQARIITVLAATSQRAEALALFDTVRSDLAEELGVTPGPELHAAHQNVLRSVAGPRGRPVTPRGTTEGTPGTTEGTEESTPEGTGPPAEDRDGKGPSAGAREDTGRTGPAVELAQLPADIPSFAGRREELERSRALLDWAGPGQQPLVIAAISGMAGMGKTSLAVHLAHSVADRFPDGQLYVDLRGFAPESSPVSAHDAMRAVIEAFGIPLESVPEGRDALASVYRGLFAGRRFLILLDNARHSEHVRPLLPGAAGCLVVVTSRLRLDGLIVTDGAHSIPLGLPTQDEGIELLVRRIGEQRVRAELPAARAIVDLCGRLPLALAIVSARAVLNPAFPLASIAAELRDSQGDLDVFSSRDRRADARSIFSWSYHTLSPDAARLFRLLSLHPATDIGRPAAAALAGVPPRAVQPRISELLDHHLLIEHQPDRFTLHELLRAYSAELCAAHDDEDTRSVARRRLYDHYLRSAYQAEAVIAPKRERDVLPDPQPGSCPLDFTGRAQAAAQWFRKERAVLLATAEQAARNTADGGPYCGQLARILEFFLDRHGRWQEQHTVQSAALDAARRVGDRSGQAYALRALGFACCRLGRHDDALAHLSQALRLLEETGDLLGQGRAHRYLAFRANVTKDHPRALDHYRKAAECYEVVQCPIGLATVLNEAGWTYLLMGSYALALERCETSVAMFQELGDRNGEAAAWDSVGCVQHRLGRDTEALVSYDHALAVYREFGDRSLEADTLMHIGDSHQALSDVASATKSWHEAMEVYESLQHPEAGTARSRLHQSPPVSRPG